MKRRLPFIFLFLLSLNVFAQDGNVFVDQVLIPHDVFIGDKAQLQYVFTSPIDFFSFAKESSIIPNQNILILNTEIEAWVSMENECSITSAKLYRSGSNYTLLLEIIPWKPGLLRFTKFNLADALELKDGYDDFSLSFEIALEPIVVASVSEKLGVSSIRPPASTLILPGTSYILWLFIVLGIVVLIAVVMLLVKMQSFILFVRGLIKSIHFFFNELSARRSLSSLLKQKLTDEEFAYSWQSVMRCYLSNRFALSIGSVPSGAVVSCVYEAMSSLLTDAQDEALTKLSGFFVRTDYIRFASSAIDFAGAMQENERKNIVAETKECIKVIESSKEADK